MNRPLLGFVALLLQLLFLTTAAPALSQHWPSVPAIAGHHTTGPVPPQRSASVVFIGTQPAMEVFARQVRELSAKEPASAWLIPSEWVVHPETWSPDEHCLEVINHSVVMDVSNKDQSKAWIDCAARGANLLLLAEDSPVPNLTPNESVMFGAGRVAWLTKRPSQPLVMERRWDELFPPLARTAVAGLGYTGHQNRNEEHSTIPSTFLLTVLGLFAAAVLLLGAITWHVERWRQAKIPGLLGLVLGTSVVLWFGLGGANAKPAVLHIEQVLLTSSDGVGLAATSIQRDGPLLEPYEVTLSWTQGQIAELTRPQMYGSPLRRTELPLEAHEDKTNSNVTLSGLLTGPRSAHSARWVESIRVTVPTLRTQNGLEINNTTAYGIRRARLVTDQGNFACGDMMPGQTSVLTAATPATGAAGRSTSLDAIVAMATGENLMPRGSYLLAVEFDDTSSTVGVSPASEHAVRKTLVMVGTLASAGAQR